MNFPSRQQLIELLGGDDYFVWEYYGKILGWIFRSRVKVILRLFGQLQPKPVMVLDVGCGPMFVSCSLVGDSSGEYVGVDVLTVERLKKYKGVAKKLGVRTIEVVRASAELLPLRSGIFDFVLSLDVLEHLSKPKDAVMEIGRVAKDGSLVAVSLPLENSLQRLSRIGFRFIKPKSFSNDAQDSTPKSVSITRTPDYHYAGNVGSYDRMYEILSDNFESLCTKYTPLGFHRSININAIHILRN